MKGSIIQNQRGVGSLAITLAVAAVSLGALTYVAVRNSSLSKSVSSELYRIEADRLMAKATSDFSSPQQCLGFLKNDAVNIIAAIKKPDNKTNVVPKMYPVRLNNPYKSEVGSAFHLKIDQVKLLADWSASSKSFLYNQGGSTASQQSVQTYVVKAFFNADNDIIASFKNGQSYDGLKKLFSSNENGQQINLALDVAGNEITGCHLYTVNKDNKISSAVTTSGAAAQNCSSMGGSFDGTTCRVASFNVDRKTGEVLKNQKKIDVNQQPNFADALCELESSVLKKQSKDQVIPYGNETIRANYKYPAAKRCVCVKTNSRNGGCIGYGDSAAYINAQSDCSKKDGGKFNFNRLSSGGSRWNIAIGDSPRFCTSGSAYAASATFNDSCDYNMVTKKTKPNAEFAVTMLCRQPQLAGCASDTTADGRYHNPGEVYSTGAATGWTSSGNVKSVAQSLITSGAKVQSVRLMGGVFLGTPVIAKANSPQSLDLDFDQMIGNTLNRVGGVGMLIGDNSEAAYQARLFSALTTVFGPFGAVLDKIWQGRCDGVRVSQVDYKCVGGHEQVQRVYFQNRSPHFHRWHLSCKDHDAGSVAAQSDQAVIDAMKGNLNSVQQNANVAPDGSVTADINQMEADFLAEVNAATSLADLYNQQAAEGADVKVTISDFSQATQTAFGVKELALWNAENITLNALMAQYATHTAATTTDAVNSGISADQALLAQIQQIQNDIQAGIKGSQAIHGVASVSSLPSAIATAITNIQSSVSSGVSKINSDIAFLNGVQQQIAAAAAAAASASRLPASTSTSSTSSSSTQ